MNKEFFKANPSLNEYFETSDGKKFYTENAAQNHAKVKALKDRTVNHVERPEELEEKVVVPHSPEKKLSKMTKAELKALAAELGIEVTDETNAELVVLIETAQSEPAQNESQTPSDEDNTPA